MDKIMIAIFALIFIAQVWVYIATKAVYDKLVEIQKILKSPQPKPEAGKRPEAGDPDRKDRSSTESARKALRSNRMPPTKTPR